VLAPVPVLGLELVPVLEPGLELELAPGLVLELAPGLGQHSHRKSTRLPTQPPMESKESFSSFVSPYFKISGNARFPTHLHIVHLLV